MKNAGISIIGAVICVLCFWVGRAEGDTITVGLGGGYDFDNFQAAIDDANDGDEVVVADGTYTGEGNRDIDFLGKSITVRSENGPNDRIVDCEGQGSGFYFRSGEDGNSIIDGITITNWDEYEGAGIWCERSSPTITNCTMAGGLGYPASLSSVFSRGGFYPEKEEASGLIPDELVALTMYYKGNAAGVRCIESSPEISNCTLVASGFGVLSYYSSPRITSCTVIGNITGISSFRYSRPTISSCIISGNYDAGVNGGSLTITDCIISDNWASGVRRGGPHTVITDCTISGNGAYDWGLGGGVHCRGKSLTVIDCVITGNRAEIGGGIYFAGEELSIRNSVISNNTAEVESGGVRGSGEPNAAIVNCIISNNKTRGFGGGLIGCVGVIRNCVISGNQASSGGGLGDCHGEIENCTIVGNKAKYRGGAGAYSRGFKNCIIWGNTTESRPQLSWLGGTTYSCIEGWTSGGLGNINADPCFVEAGYWADANDVNIIVEPNDPNAVWVDGDYHLLWTSPCIDAGDPNYIPAPNEIDLDGNPRILNGDNNGIPVVDMGAYEFIPTVDAFVDIRPEALNLISRGKWITCNIGLPNDYNVSDIDPNSVFLEDEIAAEWLQINDQIATAKFSRSDVQEMLEPGEVELTVSGKLLDGTRFEGTDVIRVIDKGGKKK